jgi:hypothetical protein
MNVLILSATYGLLAASTPISSYDQRINPDRANASKRRQSRLNTWLKGWLRITMLMAIELVSGFSMPCNAWGTRLASDKVFWKRLL